MEMTITRLDAARRQLETAIDLYFHDGDPVSIHTLTGAAYELLRGLGIHEGSPEMIKDWYPDYVRKDKVKFVGDRLNAAQKFFKHAFPNPDGVFVFVPEETDVLLLDACWAYKRLSGTIIPRLKIFEGWAYVTWAHEVVSYGTDPLPEERRLRYAQMSRQEYFDQMLPVALEYEATQSKDKT